ncbi:MAG: hypothetical protein OT477_17490 [Chloroflexi bacterium]|nr:hypothetical protein [Chloroflexota bacterium]
MSKTLFPLRGRIVLLAFVVWATAVLPAPAHSTGGFTTTITIDSSDDPDNSLTSTCTFDSGIYNPAPDGRCTLRRAILEASARPQSDRPIQIVFNLASDDPNHNRDAADTWTIVMEDSFPPLKTPSIIDLNGQVVLDGNTQSGGRTDAPKILIDTADYSLEVESENNTIRNLAFINGGAIFLKEDGNLLEYVWLGLSADGQSIQLRTPDQPQRLATGGISILSSNNIVRYNTVAGSFAPAIDTNTGTTNNQIVENQIGTRADGTVAAVAPTIQCIRNLNYDPANWYGGWGLQIGGSGHTITNNRIAGLHILQTANETAPMALDISGQNHLIEENIIGVDSAGAKVGVCGQGIKFSGSGTDILNNTIVGSRASFPDSDGAILALDSSPTFGQVTIQGNIVEDGPGEIYIFGQGIPMALRQFRPGRITAINGTQVTGTNGINKDGVVSACPNCTINFYLDDLDETGETLTHLGSATADANGDFTFNLPQPLAADEGIRTSSTTTSVGVIGTLGTGTTSAFSGLYVPTIEVEISGATTGEENDTFQFQLAVSPVQSALPITYTINATDFAENVVVLDSASSTQSLSWETPGLKTIEVTVDTGLATATMTHQIQIGEPIRQVFLPLITR